MTVAELTMAHEKIAFIPAPPGLAADESDLATHYLIIRLGEDGRIEVQGSRAELDMFLHECARAGLFITLDYLSWCG